MEIRRTIIYKQVFIGGIFPYAGCVTASNVVCLFLRGAREIFFATSFDALSPFDWAPYELAVSRLPFGALRAHF